VAQPIQPWYYDVWRSQYSHGIMMCGAANTAMVLCVAQPIQPWYYGVWRSQYSHGIMCGAANTAMVPEPMNFDKGLIFVKGTDILLSGDRWTIVVNIALNDYDVLIENIKFILNTVCKKIEVHKIPNHTHLTYIGKRLTA
jgi:hypothetical protein